MSGGETEEGRGHPFWLWDWANSQWVALPARLGPALFPRSFSAAPRRQGLPLGTLLCHPCPPSCPPHLDSREPQGFGKWKSALAKSLHTLTSQSLSLIILNDHRNDWRETWPLSITFQLKCAHSAVILPMTFIETFLFEDQKNCSLSAYWQVGITADSGHFLCRNSNNTHSSVKELL